MVSALLLPFVMMLLSALCTTAFLPKSTPNRVGLSNEESSNNIWLSASSSSSNSDGGSENPSNDTQLVTKEMFLRELLKHPADHDEETPAIPSVTVHRKNKKSKKKPYKVLDNRDSLPFAVQVTTPDPYTHPDVKKKVAQKQSVKPKKRHDAVEAGISSSLYVDLTNSSASSNSNDKKKNKKGKKRGNNKDDDDSSAMTIDPSTHLGDFVLDKLTTTGDVLEIGDRQYKVVRHKCQYKYAGGKRFVMARKILQVKEVGRLQKEEYLKKQFQDENTPESFPPEEA